MVMATPAALEFTGHTTLQGPRNSLMLASVAAVGTQIADRIRHNTRGADKLINQATCVFTGVSNGSCFLLPFQFRSLHE